MKIGDRVFARGYIDEIRKDTVIIRNAGGYFGTIPSEVITGELPSAQPETNCSEIPNNSDLISRQAAIDAICAVCGNDCDKSEFVYNAPQDEQVILCPEHYCLCNLPSTQPERKMGHWIYEERKRLVDETDDGPVYRTEKWWSCSECGYAKGYQISKPSSNYCENCGAKMLKDGE